MENADNTPLPRRCVSSACTWYNGGVPIFLRLLSSLRPYKTWVVWGFVCLVVSVALELAPPLVWGQVVDNVVIHRHVRALLPAVLWLTVIQGATVLLSAVRTRLLESVGQRFTFDLRNTLYAKLSYQSLAFYNEARTGDLMSRLSSDVDAVQEVVIRGTDSVVANFLRLAGVSVIFCSLNLKLGLATLVPIVLVGVFLKAFNGRVKAVYKAARAQLGAVNTRLQDNLTGIRIIKSFAREGEEIQGFEAVNRRYLQDNLDAIKLRATFFPFVRWLASFGNTITIGYGAWLILHGQFTLGGLIAYRGYGRYFFGPIDDLTQINDTVQRAVAAGTRLFDVLDAPVSLADAPDATNLGLIDGAIAFQDVSFAYKAGASPVLQDLTLQIAPGQTAALVGESGAGKSTIFALVSRFWDPDSGSVLVDNHDLRTITQHSLRRQIASVQQDTFLFAASVRDNIRYARPEASDADVEASARAANAHDFIMGLPQGYGTTIGERGIKLSGGQRQRLSVARAFLADPRILLLDEATSAVEPESERIIQDAIERLMRGRTTILAAHRLSTVRKADIIFVLSQGRLAEQGTHDQLMRRGGLYARMVTQQSEGFLAEQPVGAEA